jgi:putative transcriptional regulator
MAKRTPKKRSSKRKLFAAHNPELEIPARLLAMRHMKGWSQSEAAEYLGISASVLRALETGKARASYEDLIRIADVYGTSLDHLFGRSESVIERFSSATSEVQSANLSGIMVGIARLTQNPEALRYIDELATMAANELPDWPSFQSYRDSPAPQRMAMLEQLAQTIARLVRDRDAVKYVGAIILQFARTAGIAPESSVSTYSMERDEDFLTHTMTNIERLFHNKEMMTPSRFTVDETPIEKPKKAKGKSKEKTRSVRKPARKK